MDQLPEEGEQDSLNKKIEEFVFRFRYPLLVTLVGVILIGLGAFFVKTSTSSQKPSIEVLESATVAQTTEITVEVAGEVENPGVYKFSSGSRIEDALLSSGGLSKNADRIWVEKSLNRAAKLLDGQKIYIPSVEENQDNPNQSTVLSANVEGVYQNGSSTFSTNSSGLTNINTADLGELDKLPGIGPVYGQRIIDQRPYSTIEELTTRDILPKSTFEKIKGKIAVY